MYFSFVFVVVFFIVSMVVKRIHNPMAQGPSGGRNPPLHMISVLTWKKRIHNPMAQGQSTKIISMI